MSLILDLLWHELFFDLSFFIGLLLARAGPCLIVGFSPFSPFFTPSVVLLPFLPWCYLTYACWPLWACCLFFFRWLNVVIGFIFMLLWAFLTHYITRGLLCPISFFLSILGPFAFLGILGLFSSSAFPWVFTNFFGLLWPNYLILHPWGSWAFP